MQAATVSVAPSSNLLRPRSPAHLCLPSLALPAPIRCRLSAPAFSASALHSPSPSSHNPRLPLAPLTSRWISPPPLVPAGCSRDAGVGASEDGVGDSGEKSGSLAQTLLLGALFGLWYIFNIYFNIYNKQVLERCDH